MIIGSEILGYHVIKSFSMLYQVRLSRIQESKCSSVNVFLYFILKNDVPQKHEQENKDFTIFAILINTDDFVQDLKTKSYPRVLQLHCSVVYNILRI